MDENHGTPAHVLCEGWWEQAWFGRQAMDNLRLVFGEGTIAGSGRDIVGPFTLSGSISTTGVVTILKQYIGLHNVDYIGNYDGEGTFLGRWHVDRLQGPWMIKIRRLDEPAE